MIVYNGKWRIRADRIATWPAHLERFTEAVRSEPGLLFFDAARHLDEENTYTVIEAFADEAAEARHERSDHFRRWIADAPAYVAETPKVLRFPVAGRTAWGTFDAVVVGADPPPASLRGQHADRKAPQAKGRGRDAS